MFKLYAKDVKSTADKKRELLEKAAYAIVKGKWEREALSPQTRE